MPHRVSGRASSARRTPLASVRAQLLRRVGDDSRVLKRRRLTSRSVQELFDQLARFARRPVYKALITFIGRDMTEKLGPPAGFTMSLLSDGDRSVEASLPMPLLPDALAWMATLARNPEITLSVYGVISAGPAQKSSRRRRARAAR